MKIIGAGAAAGAALGGVVGVVVHFMSRTLPSTFYVGTAQAEGQDRATISSGPPHIHPSWWPSLFVTVAVGLVIGVLVIVVGRRLGFRLSRG